MCFPAHTTHILQPVDEALFKSLKYNWNLEGRICGQTAEASVSWSVVKGMGTCSNTSNCLGRVLGAVVSILWIQLALQVSVRSKPDYRQL